MINYEYNELKNLVEKREAEIEAIEQAKPYLLPHRYKALLAYANSMLKVARSKINVHA